MGKLKHHLLPTWRLIMVVVAFTLVGSTAALSENRGESTFKSGAKVITLVEDLALCEVCIFDLDPVDVSGFRFVSLLGNHNGGLVPVVGSFVFSTEAALAAAPVPRARFECTIGGGPNGGVVFCDQPLRPIRVGGPFLAGTLRNETGVDVLITLKVFLTR